MDATIERKIIEKLRKEIMEFNKDRKPVRNLDRREHPYSGGTVRVEKKGTGAVYFV